MWCRLAARETGRQSALYRLLLNVVDMLNCCPRKRSWNERLHVFPCTVYYCFHARARVCVCVRASVCLYICVCAYDRVRETEIAQILWVNIEQGFLSHRNKMHISEKKKKKKKKNPVTSESSFSCIWKKMGGSNSFSESFDTLLRYFDWEMVKLWPNAVSDRWFVWPSILCWWHWRSITFLTEYI